MNEITISVLLKNTHSRGFFKHRQPRDFTCYGTISQLSLHLHNSVHGNCSILHKDHPLHSFLQPQCFRIVSAFDALGKVIHNTSHFSDHLQSVTSSKVCTTVVDWHQTSLKQSNYHMIFIHT